VRAAAREFTVPLVGSSASTIIIFAPLAFLSGVTGAFFKVLSLTMAASLVVSFLAAYLVVPVMAARLLTQKDADQKETGRVAAWFNRSYAAMMGPLLRHSWMVLVLMVPVVAIGYLAYERTGTGFMPKMDEGGFVLDYLAKPGTSLSETDRLLKQVEGILHETPEVQTYSRRTGLQLDGLVAEASGGDFFVRLKPMPRRPIEKVMDEVRQKVGQSVPGLEIELAQLKEDVIGDLTAVPQPIEIKLYSDDTKALNALAPRVAKAIEKVPGVVDVKSGVVIAGDALDIDVNREKAALEGMDPDSVTKALTAYLSGLVTTQVQRGPKMVGVRLWVSQSDRATADSLPGIQLRAPDGHLFPLGRVAEIKSITGQPQIMRDDLKRVVAVKGRISGRDLGSTVKDVRKVLSQSGLIPPDLYYSLGGLYEQQQVAFRGLVMVLVAATALVFVLLLFLYESFRVAVAMLMIPLLSTAAVFVGLWLTGIELNITSMMGLTMIVGIATEASIFYYSEYRQIENEEGLPYPRLVQAGINRMRPIIMMKLAAICALLPLALGWGQGSAMQQPLAVAIIAGLIIQLPLTLIALPALLRMMGEGREDTETRRRGDAEKEQKAS
jgi:multidrug efflux pump subunit AcrB